jgi:hypothetical protein
VEASAPGYKGWSAKVDVAHDGAQETATVPPLEALPPELAAPPSAPGVTPTQPGEVQGSPPGGPPSSPHAAGSVQRTVGLVVAGAGVVGLGVSGVLALVASGKNSDSNSAGCNNDVCRTQASFDDRNAARSAGDGATVALVVGAAAVVVGGVIWLTAPKAGSGGSARVYVAPVPGGAVIAGAW